MTLRARFARIGTKIKKFTRVMVISQLNGGVLLKVKAKEVKVPFGNAATGFAMCRPQSRQHGLPLDKEREWGMLSNLAAP